MLNDICGMIKIRSDRGEVKEGMFFGEGFVKVLNVVLELVLNMGFKIKNYDNYVGVIDLNDNEKVLDILVYLDVVLVSDDWKVIKLFELIIKDGKLYGRGSSDDKGLVIVVLYVLKVVRDLNILISKNVCFILGIDEECGSGDIEYYYKIEKEVFMIFLLDVEYLVINIEKGCLSSIFESKFSEDVSFLRILLMKSGMKVNVVLDKVRVIIEGFSKNEISNFIEKIFNMIKVKFIVNEENNKFIIDVKGNGVYVFIFENGDNVLIVMLELFVILLVVKSEGFERLCVV